LRGHRGGVLILDPEEEQVYKPLAGRMGGDDFVCETLNAVWSLGDRGGSIAVERRKNGERHPCRGYPGLRAHSGNHKFTKRHLLLLLTRHRLKVRIVLAESKVIHIFIVCIFIIIPSVALACHVFPFS